MTTPSPTKSSHVLRAGLALLVAGSVSGCFHEELPIFDLRGTIVVPRDAAEINGLLDPATGIASVTPIADVRAIGPVYVGLYAAIRNDLDDYPLPEPGPSLVDLEGTSFALAHPYGGTTVGDIRNGCVKFLQCRTISGRYKDYDALVEWFSDYLGTPVVDGRENEINNGDGLREACFELLNATADDEVRITPTEDRNDDGEIDENDLDFVEDANGDFVAEFLIRQAEFYEGMTAWAFLDTPSGVGFSFDTCSTLIGQQNNEYNANYQAGAQEINVLNIPAAYLVEGDYVARKGFVWTDPEAPAELVLDFKIGRDDVADLDDNSGSAK